MADDTSPRIDLFASREPLAPPPRRRRRGSFGRLVLLAGTATILGVGVWVVVAGPLNPDRLKARIERAVSHATGRAFVIGGALHVTPGLSPLIAADDISLANIPGGSRPQMLTARSLSARVALLPLLAGDVIVDQVTLTAPDLLLEQAPDGTPNWQFSPLRRPLFSGGGASGGGGGGDEVIEVHHLHLEDGQLAWRRAVAAGDTAAPPMLAALQSADLTTSGNDSPVHGSFTGQIAGIELSGTVDTGAFSRLQGGPVTALAGAWPLTLRVTAGNATASLVGGVNHPDELRGYSFLLTANTPSLAPFAHLLPAPLALPLRDVNLTARLSDGANGEFQTSGLSAQAGAADLSSAIPGLILKNAVFSAPGPGQQAQLTVDGVFQGAALRLAGTATQPDVLAANVPVPLAFSGQVASASLSARGTVPAALEHGGLAGGGLDLLVSVRAPTLADLSPLAGRPLPDVRDLALEAHFGDAGFRLRGVALRDLVFSSSLGDVSGAVTVAWAPVPTLSGTLNSKHIDLDAAQAAWSAFLTAGPASPAPPTPPAPVVAPSSGAASPLPDAAPAPRLFSDTKLPFDELHGADADLTLSAASITAGHESYHDFQAHLLANDGKLILNPLRLAAPQGVLIGALSLDASIDPPPVAVTLRSPSLSAAGLAAALGYPGAATGAVQVDAQLNGTGDTPHDLAASLGGHLGVTMVNGAVGDALFNGPLGAALIAAGVPPLQGSTDVRCFALRTDFSHGQGQVQALSLDTSKVSVDGDGSVDLGHETLALHLRPIIRLGGTGVAAPVSLTGGFFDLKAGLDNTMGGGRYGLTIGGPGPSDNGCIAELSQARGGMPGPMPSLQPAPAAGGKHRKPIDLLRGLLHP